MSRPRITPAEFRRLAERITDISANLLESLDTAPAMPQTSGQTTEQLFHGWAPEEGIGERAVEELAAVVAHSRPPGPRFFGYVFGSGEPVAALGDYLASILNQNVTAWRSAPAAVAIERTVVEWLADAIGCHGFTGSLCGGGSAANLMGLAMAREEKAPANEPGAQPGVVYASQEAHMSIAKAVALLGLGRQNLHAIPVDGEFRMDAGALDRAIGEDRKAGRTPIAVVACAGTVSTGAIDPLNEIADVAKRHGVWLHVDGAYGALAAMAIPEAFAGLNRTDSLSLDPHKWLYQPADCGCLLYKDPGWARVAFSHTGEYARPLTEDPTEGFAFFEESMELSRPFRALKLWLSLRYHGMQAFRESIRQDLTHARHLEQSVRQHPALEMLAAGPLSAVCFRYVGGANDLPRLTDEGELDRMNAAILQHLVRVRGRVFLSNTSIRNRFALRACIVNHRSRRRDVDMIIEEVLESAREVATGGPDR